jgi:hypothetical protein
MKRSILVLAVALACLVAAPTALAQSRVGCDPGGPAPGGAGFFARGTVSAVDTTNDLLTVTVTKGSDGLPTPLVVTITDDTQIVQLGHPGFCGNDQITLDQVLVGENVRVCGTVDSSSGTAVYDAARVAVSQPRFFCVGAVSAVDTTNGVLQVDVAHGSAGLPDQVDLVVTDDTDLLSFVDGGCSAIDLSQVQVADQVAVCGVVDSSSGAAVYDARVVFDCGADPLPAPASKPAALSVVAAKAAKGANLKVGLRVADPMPGCTSARVTVAVVNARGVTVAVRTVSAVALNKTVRVSIRLHHSLMRGTYHIVTRATDQAGNRQARAGKALLRVH